MKIGISYCSYNCAAKDMSDTVKSTCCESPFEEQQLPPAAPYNKQWSPPPAVVLKLNTNAAFEAVSGISAGRAIARNDLG